MKTKLNVKLLQSHKLNTKINLSYCKWLYSEVAKQCKSNPKKCWKYVNSKYKSQTRIGDVKTVASDSCVVVANDDVDKANIFGNYFSCVYTPEYEGEYKELPPRGLAVS